MATGALFVGFAALDAPARTRAAWQAAVTPLVALAAALGVLTGHSPALAVPTMALVGAIAGYCFAVSLRLAIAGLSVALSLLISQGLEIPISHAPEALLFAGLGGVLQVAFSLCGLRRRRPRSRGGGEPLGCRRGQAQPLDQPHPRLDRRPSRPELRRRTGGGRRRLLAARHARARLLDPADDPLRAAARKRARPTSA